MKGLKGIIYILINMTISLTLSPQKSKLDNITRLEKYDVKTLNKLINSSLLLKDPWFGYENEKAQLIKYRTMKDTIIYKKKCSYGRTFCRWSAGLQSLRKEIRHTLAKDYYIDIDIVNCHPVLLLQILKMNKYETIKYISKYVSNRDEYINLIIEKYNVSRDDAKQLFIRLMYGGSFHKWASDLKLSNVEEAKFINKFQNEMKSIQILITNSNKHLKETIENMKDRIITNIESTTTSYYLQDIENRILEDVYNYCCDNGFILKNNCVFCYDGIMISKEKYKPELLTELTDFI